MSSTDSEYFLGDALNSVRQLVDGDGNPLLSESYDPFGSAFASQGDGSSVYGYTGEYTDASGLVYLRARYYEPGMGRFTSQDTWGGDYKTPMSYNLWLYTGSNPIDFTDPSGLCSMQDEACLKVSHELIVSYGWYVEGIWQLSDVQMFYNAAQQISRFFNNHGGNGSGRMRAIAPIYLIHAEDRWMGNLWKELGFHHTFMREIILLPSISQENIIHEFGHIIDNVKGTTLLASIIGGGPSDDFARNLGVEPSQCLLRFSCTNYEQMLKAANAELPIDNYAYNGPSEDFAVTFEKSVISDFRTINENPVRVNWITNFIEQQQESHDLYFDPAPIPIPECQIPEVLRTPGPNE